MNRRTIRDLTNAERDEIARSYVVGSTIKQIASRFRLSINSVRRLLVSRAVLIRSREQAQPVDYVPSPEEIETQKVELRRRWTEDGYHRNDEPRQPYVPRIHSFIGEGRRLRGAGARGID